MNIPYVKINKDDELAQSYFHTEPSRRQRRIGIHQRPFNNRKGSRVRVFKTLKFKEHVQRVDGKTIVHLTT